MKRASIVFVVVVAVAVAVAGSGVIWQRMSADRMAREESLRQTQLALDNLQRELAVALSNESTAKDEASAVAVAKDAAAAAALEAQAAAAAATTRADQLVACIDDLQRALNKLAAGDSAAELAASRECVDTTTTNAAYPYDFADPSVLVVDGVYIAYATTGPLGKVQVITSSDLASWSMTGDGLGRLPDWSDGSVIWAPSVRRFSNGFVMYFSGRMAGTSRFCIGTAVSSTAVGPFVPTGPPLVCPDDGAIDPSTLTDTDGATYLLWKGDRVGHNAIWSQALSADGLSFIGEPSQLISADRASEEGVVEAPSMALVSGTYYLLYSANNWNSARYYTAAATCSSPTGPCVKSASSIVTGADGAGAGGAEVFTDGTTLRVAFHAWALEAVGYPNTRYLGVGDLTISDGKPAVVTA